LAAGVLALRVLELAGKHLFLMPQALAHLPDEL
jgi:hypothetical protein